jgi:hypothetical protein
LVLKTFVAAGQRRRRAFELFESSENVMRRLQVAAVWLILAGAATYLFLFDPAKGVGYPSCPFRMLTGLQCPGCGAARGLHQLLHGHPLAAFELNPLVMISLPFVGFGLLALTRSAARSESPRSSFLPPPYGWMVLGMIVSFWIFRNTSLYPFSS